MKSFINEIRIAIVATIVFAIVLCGFYPLIIWDIGQLFFPAQANGSLITNASGQVVGSKLIGQEFTSPKYFQPRPSAAGTGYDASASSGTNLGPTSQKLADSIKANIVAYRAENNLATSTPVPADAVESSASGLDPDISIQNAALQAPRVAKERGIPLATVQALIKKNTTGQSLGFLGVAGVNVLTLNIALDNLSHS